VVEYLQGRCANAAALEDVEGACPLVYTTCCVMKDVTVNIPLDAYNYVTPCSEHIKVAIFLLPYSPLAIASSSRLSNQLRVLRLPACCGRPADLKCMVQAFPPKIMSDEKFNCELYECLKIVVDKNRWDFVKYLLQTFSQSIKSAMVSESADQSSAWYTWKLNPFQNACKQARISVVKMFLDHKICKPDTISIKEALERKHYDLVSYLLTSTEHPIVMDECEYSNSLLSEVLSSPWQNHGEDAIKLIASNGVNGKDVDGNTVLHLACEYSVVSLVKEYSCNDQSTLNKEGQLPLHTACSKYNLEVIKLVSSQPGLNLNAKDSDGNTPVHILSKQRGIILESGQFSCRNKSLVLECFKYLILEKKCDIVIQNKRGQLPLHILLGHLRFSNSASIDEGIKKDLITLVSTNKSVNVQDTAGNTPLHIACEIKDWVTALYLTSTFHCDVNMSNNCGCLPLHCAIHRVTVATRDRHEDYMYTYHATETESQFESESSPLRAEDMSLEVVKAVSDGCTQLLAEDSCGKTPLHIACREARLDIVEYLIIQKKILYNLEKSCKIYSHLDIRLACKDENDFEILNALANEKNIDNCEQYYYHKFNREDTPLHIACKHHNIKAIKLLRDLNCDFSCVNSQGMLPLHMACSYSLDLVKEMVIQDEHVRKCDKNGNTALHLACKHNLCDAVKYLISNFPCDLTIQNSKGELPLHLACNAKNLEMVKVLSNCDVNHQTVDKDTPLHIACRVGALDIVKYLLNECGGDPSLTLKNSDERLPFHYACEHSLELVKLVDKSFNAGDLILENAYGTPLHDKQITVLEMACSLGLNDIISFLIKQKFSGREIDHSALAYACGMIIIKGRNGKRLSKFGSDSDESDADVKAIHPNTVNFLITEHGYNPAVSIGYNTSPIEHACKIESLELIKALTTISVDIKDSNDNTPLHYACLYDCSDITQFLIDRGCDQTVYNRNGKLALHIAGPAHSLLREFYRNHSNV
jgi:ankyrin repeat protein